MRSKQKVQVMEEYDSEASEISLNDLGQLDSSFNTSHGSGMMRRKYGQLGTAAIYQCARNNDIEGLNRMLHDHDVLKHIDELNDEGVSALHLAARFNHLQIVKLLVDFGKADPQVRDEEGATPLHYCARKRQQDDNQDNLVKIIQFLVVLVDVNARDNYNATPLHFAAVRGNLVAARELVKCKEVLINAKDQLGCTPLHDAATYGHKNVAELLLKCGARIMHLDKDMCTALHSACYEGNHEIVQLLVTFCEEKKRKQFINKKDDEDIQAIHYAIEAKCVESVRILLQNGAMVNEQCRSKTTGRSPMHLAAIEDEPKIATLLQKGGAHLAPRDINFATPLHLAAKFECLKMIKHLLKEIKTPIDLTDKDHYTALLAACCTPNKDVVRALVEEGANLRVTEKQEQNVIHLAAQWQQARVLRYLLRHIKDTPEAYLINAQDRYGNAPLHIAARVGDQEVLKLLLDNKADLFSKNEDEETPTIVASKLGQRDVIQELLKRSEKVLNDEDEYSNTALHIAAENGHTEVVKLLCEHGADKLNRNITYRIPLDLAAMKGHVDIVQYFLENDMPPEPADKETETPLQLACSNGHERVVATLLKFGADISKKNESGKCCLTVAVERGHRGVVQEILQSSKWQQALSAESVTNWDEPRQTPLRRIIRKMPDMAPIVLDKCVSKEPEGTSELSSQFYLEFNMEMLDDTYTAYDQKPCSIFDEDLTEDELLPPKDARPYTKDLSWIKENHPLMLMVKKKQAPLLKHPAVLALIRHKWSTGRLFYFLFLLYYAMFLTFVTCFMVGSTPPYFIKNENGSRCDVDDNAFIHTSQIFVYVLASFGIIIEVFQIISTSWLYFKEFVNFLDWFCYVSAIMIVAGSNDCREDWQWQLGAFTVLGVWLNFLLFFRRFPALGIYVVMVTEILRTFTRVFVIFFLFIIAFGLSFYTLLQNQVPFANVFDAIIKSWVMMIGELEYTNMFFGEGDEYSKPQYREVTYTIYVIFLMLMCIILSNLLVGLAVDDVNQLRVDASRVKLRMQIDLALDVEMALPEPLRRFFECNKRRMRIYPNAYSGCMARMSQKMTAWIEGPLLCEKTIIEAVKGLEEEKLPTLEKVSEKLSRRIFDNQVQITAVRQQLDRMELMLFHLCGGKPKPGLMTKRSTLNKLLKLKPVKEKSDSEGEAEA